MQVFLYCFIFILFKISQNKIQKINIYFNISKNLFYINFSSIFDNILYLCYFYQY